jgi:preprotein translocase subunit SecG
MPTTLTRLVLRTQAFGKELPDFSKARSKSFMQQWLPAIRIVEIVLAVAVILFILLQVRGAGLGSAFGGSSAGSVYKSRRGVERLIFNTTIVLVILFALVTLLNAAIQIK